MLLQEIAIFLSHRTCFFCMGTSRLATVPTASLSFAVVMIALNAA
jgi:hypothetical protein